MSKIQMVLEPISDQEMKEYMKYRGLKKLTLNYLPPGLVVTIEGLSPDLMFLTVYPSHFHCITIPSNRLQYKAIQASEGEGYDFAYQYVRSRKDRTTGQYIDPNSSEVKKILGRLVFQVIETDPPVEKVSELAASA